MNRHCKTTDTKLSNNSLAIRFGDDSTCSSPDPAPPPQIHKQYPSYQQPHHHTTAVSTTAMTSFSENHPNNSISNTKDRISITRAVYDLLVQREHMYDEAVQKRTDMRYEMEASALDIEKTTLQCRIEMESLQLAAQAKTIQHHHSKTESYFDAPYDTQHLLSMKKQMQQLMSARERIMINRQSSELMATHCDKLKKLASTVAAMSGVMATTREKLETAIDERSTTIHELDSNITILRSQLDNARDEISHMGEVHRASLSEKIVMTEEIGSLRNQLALVEVQANESLNISLSHHDRDKQVVARLEASLENLREEGQKHAVELEQWKAQARLDARQRADQTLLIEHSATELATLNTALEQYRSENDILNKRLEKTKFELEFQVSTLTSQVSSTKDIDDTQQRTIQQHLEEIRTLKEDLRKAWETMEREKQDRELVQGNCASELGELRERVSYLRSQIEVAEVKIKSQRDEMDDLARSHRTQLGDMEDQIRRYKSQLTDAQAQESRLLPFQQRVEELTQTIMTLAQENKAHVLEIGLLKADNTRLSHRFNSVETDTDATKAAVEMAQKLAVEKIQQLELEVVAAKGEAAQWKMNCERMQLERDTKAKEVEASHSHTSALATRKEFLAKSVTELEDLVGRLSGQVQHERALGSTTEQRIAEMRALVPYWRWEARERSERSTLSITNSAATSAYLNSSGYGSSSGGGNFSSSHINMSSGGMNHSLFR